MGSHLGLVKDVMRRSHRWLDGVGASVLDPGPFVRAAAGPGEH